MILHLYFARRFLTHFFILAIVFFSLIVMFDLVGQARRLSDYDVGFAQRAGLALLNSPQTLNEILPLIVILATIWSFVSLARSSELVVTRAAGRSALRSLISPVVVSLVIGGLAVSMLGPISAATTKRYKTLSEELRSGGVSALAISDEGLWLRQGSAEGQTVIRATRSNADGSVLYDVTFVAFSRTGAPIQRIEAKSAALGNGEWSLRTAKVWPLEIGVNAEANATRHDLLVIPSSLTLERIRETLGSPSGISIWNMPELIKQLEQSGFSARRHKVWLQAELARPFFIAGMVLVAASFTMRHARLGGTSTAVLTAVLMGFGLFFVRSFAEILGENGQIPILLAAWAPPIVAIFLALGLLLHVEDG